MLRTALDADYARLKSRKPEKRVSCLEKLIGLMQQTPLPAIAQELSICSKPPHCYFAASNFSNSASDKIVTPSSFALSNFDPGSVPTTT